VPFSIILVDSFLAFGGTSALRMLRRAVYERELRRGRRTPGNVNAKARRPVLLLGAGQAGVLAAKEIIGRWGSGFDDQGFIDDDKMKLGRGVYKD